MIFVTGLGRELIDSEQQVLAALRPGSRRAAEDGGGRAGAQDDGALVRREIEQRQPKRRFTGWNGKKMEETTPADNNSKSRRYISCRLIV